MGETERGLSNPRRLHAEGTERGLSSPRLDSGLADRNVPAPLSAGACSKRSGHLCLAFCATRANGPEPYQPGPTAQVSGLNQLRRAEGPSHRPGIARPYRPGPFAQAGMERALGAGGRRNGAWTFQSTFGFGAGDRNVPAPLSAGACPKRSGLLCHEGQRPGIIPAWANGPGCRFD